MQYLDRSEIPIRKIYLPSWFLSILIGQAPNLSAANLTVVNELSNPGTICIYHVDIPPDATTTVTDIAIQNPTDSDEELPASSTVVIGVNEIEPLS